MQGVHAAREITDDEIILALAKAGGNITQAANKIGITPKTIYNRRDLNPSIRDAIYDSRRALFDLAITELQKNIKKGDVASIIYTLKASPVAKEEGWGERTEVTGAEGAALLIKIDR